MFLLSKPRRPQVIGKTRRVEFGLQVNERLEQLFEPKPALDADFTSCYSLDCIILECIILRAREESIACSEGQTRKMMPGGRECREAAAKFQCMISLHPLQTRFFCVSTWKFCEHREMILTNFTCGFFWCQSSLVFGSMDYFKWNNDDHLRFKRVIVKHLLHHCSVTWATWFPDIMKTIVNNLGFVSSFAPVCLPFRVSLPVLIYPCMLYLFAETEKLLLIQVNLDLAKRVM